MLICLIMGITHFNKIHFVKKIFSKSYFVELSYGIPTPKTLRNWKPVKRISSQSETWKMFNFFLLYIVQNRYLKYSICAI